MTALIIDDDDDLRTVFAITLRRLGFRVLQARDGLRGLRLARAVGPDLILLDQRMPGPNGDEVARRARASGVEAPIVMISGTHDVADVAQRAGTDLWLQKPVEIEDLRTIVRRAGLEL